MGNVIKNTLLGAVYGAVGAIVLFLIGLCVEVLNVGCAILTCDCDKPTVFDWSGMWGLLLICVIGGAVIGCVYGIYKEKQVRDAEATRLRNENSEEARKQRVKWANEIKQKALSLEKNCTSNRRSTKPIVSTTYTRDNLMNDILSELSLIAEVQGKVESIAENISKKGGGLL